MNTKRIWRRDVEERRGGRRVSRPISTPSSSMAAPAICVASRTSRRRPPAGEPAGGRPARPDRRAGAPPAAAKTTSGLGTAPKEPRGRVQAEVVYVTADGRVGLRVTSQSLPVESWAAGCRSETPRFSRFSPAYDTIVSMALIDKPERARQLARAIASDLSLYHEKKLIEGIERDTLFDVMRDEIEEGRALYKSRVTPGDLHHGHLRSRAGRHAAQVRRGARSAPASGSRRQTRRADSSPAATRPGSGWTCSWRARWPAVSRSQLARQIGEAAVTVNGAVGHAVAQAARRRRGGLGAARRPCRRRSWPRRSR